MIEKRVFVRSRRNHYNLLWGKSDCVSIDYVNFGEIFLKRFAGIKARNLLMKADKSTITLNVYRCKMTYV